MLDAYIIEEIKRRERERQQRERQRPQLEIPQADDDERDRRSEREDAPTPGTVVHVELMS